MSVATVFFLFVLCSKVYFLLGYHHGTHLTAAPLWVVAIRDVSLLGLIGYFLFQLRSFQNLSKIKGSRILFGLSAALILMGFGIGLIHLMGEKPVRDVFQHYFRNGLMPTVLVPLGLAMLILRLDFPDMKKCLKIFMLINVIASYFQLIWTELMWVNRPTGLLGDPLLNSAFILIGLWLLFQDRHEQKNWQTYGGLALSIPIVYLANSLSSLCAFVAAAVFVLTLEFRKQTNKILWFRNRIRKMIVASLICFIIFSAMALFLGQQEPDELEHGVAAKAELLFHSVFCLENCGPREWFVEGRLRSNTFPFQLCRQDPAQCLFGNWKNAHYHRLDALWASLVVNWGGWFTGLYLLLFLFLPLSFAWKLHNIDRETRLAFFVFGFYWAFSLLNAGFYKYPLNILFYLSLATILYKARQQKIFAAKT